MSVTVDIPYRRLEETGRMPELRVLLVDDEPLVRQGIRDFLEREPDVTIVGECGNGVEALEAIARDRWISCSSTSRCRSWTASAWRARWRNRAGRWWCS